MITREQRARWREVASVVVEDRLVRLLDALTAADALREALAVLYAIPGVTDLLAPSGTQGSIRDEVMSALAAYDALVEPVASLVPTPERTA